MTGSDGHAVPRAVPLKKGRRYLTPSSRLAVWLGESANSQGGERFSTFAYVPQPWEPKTMDERFTLSAANYSLLVAVS